MIVVKVYTNGYKIEGHADVMVCHQVSLWHWITSNLVLGLDKDAKEYTSDRDNPSNPFEGVSWLLFKKQDSQIKWILEDCVVSLESWNKHIEYWSGKVQIEHIEGPM